MQEKEKSQKPKKRTIRKLTNEEEADIYRAFFAAGVGFMNGLLTMSRQIDRTFETLQGKELKDAKRGQSETIPQNEEGGHGNSNQEENARDSGEDG